MKSMYNIYYVVSPVFFPRQLIYDYKTKDFKRTTHVEMETLKALKRISESIRMIELSYERDNLLLLFSFKDKSEVWV